MRCFSFFFVYVNDVPLISTTVLIFSLQTSYCLIYVQCVMAAGWQKNLLFCTTSTVFYTFIRNFVSFCIT